MSSTAAAASAVYEFPAIGEAAQSACAGVVARALAGAPYDAGRVAEWVGAISTQCVAELRKLSEVSAAECVVAPAPPPPPPASSPPRQMPLANIVTRQLILEFSQFTTTFPSTAGSQ